MTLILDPTDPIVRAWKSGQQQAAGIIRRSAEARRSFKREYRAKQEIKP